MTVQEVRYALGQPITSQQSQRGNKLQTLTKDANYMYRFVLSASHSKQQWPRFKSQTYLRESLKQRIKTYLFNF